MESYWHQLLQQGALYTYLICITEQLWLPHSKYIPHSQDIMDVETHSKVQTSYA